jgi:hypothetical protein
MTIIRRMRFACFILSFILFKHLSIKCHDIKICKNINFVLDKFVTKSGRIIGLACRMILVGGTHE